MNIFKAVAAVGRGKICKSSLGGTTYILFPRVVQNFNYNPVKEKTVLGVRKIREDVDILYVELPPILMCHTDWKIIDVMPEWKLSNVTTN